MYRRKFMQDLSGYNIGSDTVLPFWGWRHD